MDGYLVLVRCGMDDLPVAILDDYEAAVDLANELDEKHVAVRKATAVLSVDSSMFHGVSVLRFVHGSPDELVHGVSWD